SQRISMILKNIVASLNRSVLEELNLSNSVGHPAENGRAREDILRKYIKKTIPSGYGVDTGFVIDATGGISKQIDIVIYRKDYHPVLEIGEVKYFMVESVVAVMENKAQINTKARLKQALDNIASVKGLDRTNRGKNVILPSGKRLCRKEFQHQIFGAILTEKSLSSKSLKKELIEYMTHISDKSLWINIYADVRGSSFRYVSEEKSAIVIPYKAVAFAISDPKNPLYTPPFIELIFELNNFLRVTPLVDYRADSYFHGTVGKAKEYVSIPVQLRG
ncbi:DUF6602 domain-containing protein, partial [Pseudoalteromonas sp. MMG012]|uniref:DUF6602 domain-containing protein n=1 Tax=Pseudoalteromonas sp. MMG012 TaxID=2822686 RepID=UPI001B3A347B